MVGGLALIAGVYLWGWLRTRDSRGARLRGLRPRRGIRSGLAGEGESFDAVEEELSGLNELISEHRQDAAAGTLGGHDAADVLMRDATEGSAYTKRSIHPVAEDKLIVLSVVAHEGTSFKGPDILTAAKTARLEFGDQGIFHHPSKKRQTEPMFSMASMVEPGVFDMNHIDQFSTPGLTLFMALPGASDDLDRFSDMLGSAEQMAASLDGELRDQAHSALSRQTIDHIREEIVDHGRRMRVMH